MSCVQRRIVESCRSRISRMKFSTSCFERGSTPDLARLLEDVVAEDARLPAVGQQQRREQADERRLPGAVLAEDRDALAALHLEADALQRRAAASLEEALPAREDLLEITHCNSCCRRQTMLLGIRE